MYLSTFLEQIPEDTLVSASNQIATALKEGNPALMTMCATAAKESYPALGRVAEAFITELAPAGTEPNRDTTMTIQGVMLALSAIVLAAEQEQR